MAKKRGVYDGLLDKLTRLPATYGDDAGRDPHYGDRVLAERELIIAEPKEDDPKPLTQGEIQALIDGIDLRFNILLRVLRRRTAGKPFGHEYAKAYAASRDLKDKLDTLRSGVTLLANAYLNLMIEQLEVEGTTSIDVFGRQIHWHMEPYAQIIDKAANRQWAIAECKHCDHHQDAHPFATDGTPLSSDSCPGFSKNDLRDGVALAWSTVNSLAKESLKAGEPLPPGVEIFAKPKASLGGEGKDSL